MLVVVYFLCCLRLLVGFSIGEVAVLEQDREEMGMSAGCFNKLNEHEVIQLLKCLGKSTASLTGLKKAAMVSMLDGTFSKLKAKELVIVEGSSSASSSNDDKDNESEHCKDKHK
jgi:hypothetical protein